MWESIVAEAAANTVSKIAIDCSTMSEDDARLQAILLQLAQAYVGGNNLLDGDIEIEEGIVAKNAILALNEILPDEVNNLIFKSIGYYEDIKLYGGNHLVDSDIKYSLQCVKGRYVFLENDNIIGNFKNLEKLFTDQTTKKGKEHLDILKSKEFEILSSLNTKILLTSETVTLRPGSVFISNLVGTEYIKIKKILNVENDIEIEGLKKIEVEISPACDYAQQKWEQHRFLQGYYIPYSIYAVKKEKLSAESYYHSPIFKDQENMFVLVLNLKCLRTCEIGEYTGTRYHYSIKDSFLHEIRNKFGQHSMRVGIMQFK
jgi:hypothetical protein